MIFNLSLCLVIVLIYLFTHLGKSEKKSKDKFFLIIVFILLFILVASREFTMGNDTTIYLRLFKECDAYKWDILGMGGRYEQGYLAFNVLLSYLHLSPRAFLCAMAFVFNFAVYRFILKNSNNYLMSTLMYVNLLFFYQSMTMMRQFLALSVILLFGFKLIKEKKLFKYLLVVIFASFFHTTALIAFLIYPLYHLKYSRKRVLIIIICSIAGLLLMSQIYPFIASLLDKEAYYSDMIGDAKLGNILATLVFFVMYLFSVFVIKKGEKQKNSFYLYSLLTTAAVYFIAINMAVLSRASQYFAILSIIALPNIVEQNIKQSRLIVQSSIIGMLILYASVIMVNRPEWNSAFNYKTCLMEKQGYYCEELP